VRLRLFIKAGLDLLYPRNCLACDEPLPLEGDMDFCRECLAALPRIVGRRCVKCGAQLGPYADDRRRCVNCRDRALIFYRAVAPCRYDGVMKKAVLGLKFGGKSAAAKTMGMLMAERLRSEDFLDEVDMIVPVPLHWRRLLERSFNQSELLADFLGRELGKRVERHLLKRVKPTRAQAQLSMAERKRNVKGVFALAKGRRLTGRTVLLCDDVMTTGETAAECSRVLRAGGAKRVYVVVAARVSEEAWQPA